MRDHRKLEVFHFAHELVLMTYKITKGYPRHEIYGLTSQMRRAAVSVVANIVEGAARQSRTEYLRFLEISLGSLRELGYFLDLSRKLGFLSEEASLVVTGKHDLTIRKLVRLVKSLQQNDKST